MLPNYICSSNIFQTEDCWTSLQLYSRCKTSGALSFFSLYYFIISLPPFLCPHISVTLATSCQTFAAEVRRELKTLLALSAITCPRPSHLTAPSRAGRTWGRSTALPPRPRRRWADGARPGTAHSSRPWARVQLPSQIGAQGYLRGAARIMRGRGPARPGGRVC